MSDRDDATEHQWRARPVLAGLLRSVLLAVPLVASSAAVLLVARLLPPGRSTSWWGLGVLLLTAIGVSMAVERATRRLLPIALLLKLSMIFPDRAPSRFKLARAAAVRPPGHELLTESEPTTTADLVLNLVAALGTHDRRTRGHSERVRLLCDMLAEELKLDDDARDRLRWSSLLHDVGKMKVSTSILNKPGKLDAQEFDRIKQHPTAGAELAAPLLPWLGEWGDGIVDHHEKYDGTGYPGGKAGTQISTAGRLIGLIDAFETMTAARPYKKAMATKAAREELARCAGTHFDPLMVRAFLAISLPRVLWAMGPLSFLFQLPFLRPLAEAGVRTGVVAPQAAAAALASGAAGAVLVGGGLGGFAGPATTGTAELLGSPELRSSQGAAPYSLQDRVLPTVDELPVEEAPGTAVLSGSQDDAVSGAEPGGSVQQGRTTTSDTETESEPALEPVPTSSGGTSQPGAPTTGDPSRPSTDAPAESPTQPGSGPEPASPGAPSQPDAPAAEQPPSAEAPDDPEPVVLVPDPQPVATSPAAETTPAATTPAPEPSASASASPSASASSSPASEPVPTASSSPDPVPTAGASTSPEPEPTATASADPEPTASASAGPTASATATPTPTGNPQVSAAILDGPADVVDSRTATFTLAAGTWECQVLRNGDGTGSSFGPCSGTHTVTLRSDGAHTMRVRDTTSGTLYSWTWTVDPAYVAAQAASDPTPLIGIDLSDGLPAGPGAGLTLMALLMAAATPVAALARRVRERRTTPTA